MPRLHILSQETRPHTVSTLRHDLSRAWARHICAACTGEEFLKLEIRSRGAKEKCSYCNSTAAALRIDVFAGYIQAALEDHYECIPQGSKPQGDGAPAPMSEVISSIAGITEFAAEDVRVVIHDRYQPTLYEQRAGYGNPFGPDVLCQRKPIEILEYLRQWEHFRKTILTESRLFNSKAEAILGWIFADLDKHTTAGGSSIIVSAGPETSIKVLYRARAFQSDEKLIAAIARPDTELGPPPPTHAVAGRMNSRHIGVFYGATHPSVAIAEIRPPVGCRVLVGRFEVTRPLRLLDLEAMRTIQPAGNVFDRSFRPAIERAAFLDMLSELVTRPVLPDDEASDYLVTQAIADYLATRIEPALDGVIYPSAQQKGAAKRNVVLFRKAAKVESIRLPAHAIVTTNATAVDEDEAHPKYVLHISRPPEGDDPQRAECSASDDDNFWNSYRDVRDVSLRIQLRSLRVFHVEGVKFFGSDFAVSRVDRELTHEEFQIERDNPSIYF